jgi:hypothetical protein
MRTCTTACWARGEAHSVVAFEAAQELLKLLKLLDTPEALPILKARVGVCA